MLYVSSSLCDSVQRLHIRIAPYRRAVRIWDLWTQSHREELTWREFDVTTRLLVTAFQVLWYECWEKVSSLWMCRRSAPQSCLLRSCSCCDGDYARPGRCSSQACSHRHCLKSATPRATHPHRKWWGVAWKMKVDDNCHDFTKAQRWLPDAQYIPIWQRVLCKFRFEGLAKIFNVTEKVTHPGTRITTLTHSAFASVWRIASHLPPWFTHTEDA